MTLPGRVRGRPDAILANRIRPKTTRNRGKSPRCPTAITSDIGSRPFSTAEKCRPRLAGRPRRTSGNWGHGIADATGIPLAATLTGGNRNDKYRRLIRDFGV
ncbi:hypothetical protein [Streptomyces sp. NPDC017260]|uniref:hypothetical protein n=1 Tax=unclassified Streptomyces TaxID=2593676 RepID=UPI0037A04C9F